MFERLPEFLMTRCERISAESAERTMSPAMELFSLTTVSKEIPDSMSQLRPGWPSVDLPACQDT